MTNGCFSRFDFGWSRGTPLKVKEQTVTFADLKDSGRCDALFMWWEVYMDPEKTVLLSCAPRWAHPVYKDTPELLLVRIESQIDLSVGWLDLLYKGLVICCLAALEGPLASSHLLPRGRIRRGGQGETRRPDHHQQSRRVQPLVRCLPFVQ